MAVLLEILLNRPQNLIFWSVTYAGKQDKIKKKQFSV